MTTTTEAPHDCIVDTELLYLANHAEGLALLILDTLAETEIDEGRLEAAHASMGILYGMLKQIRAEVDAAEGRELDARHPERVARRELSDEELIELGREAHAARLRNGGGR